MARPKGQPKLGGRKKGTPNKKSLRFRDLLEENKVDFEVELAKAIVTGNVDMIKALKDLLPYLQPKISTEVSSQAPPIEPVDNDDDNLLALVKA